MDTIQDTPEETFVAGVRYSRTPKSQAKSRYRVRGRPFTREPDWHSVALIGAGIAAGAVLGAGIALLMAPQSGAHTRLALTSEFRRRRPWQTSPWERLGDELKKAAHRRNRLLHAGDFV